MLEDTLLKSYKCLASIGNSFEVESMISEVIITFSRTTDAIAGSYFRKKEDTTPLVKIGKNIPAFTVTEEGFKQKQFIHTLDEMQVVVLPLKRGYLLFAYDIEQNNVESLAVMFGGFLNKINISLHACEGVYNLEQTNEELESRVEASVKKIRENEKLLLLQSKQAVMGEMLEMIAHQWRQPLTTIGMISNNIIFDLLLLEDIDKEDLKISLEKINQQVSHLSDTIDDFRDFFKTSKKRQKLEIQDIIDGVLNILGKQLKNKNIELLYSQEHSRVSIVTYKNYIIQVLVNIISNAKDAFEKTEIENKKITIKCQAFKDNVSITIEDNAGGIKEELLEKVFEPYFTTKRQLNGTGLGLYMSMVIVQKHLHGDLKVKNNKNGASFEMLLPYGSLNDE